MARRPGRAARCRARTRALDRPRRGTPPRRAATAPLHEVDLRVASHSRSSVARMRRAGAPDPRSTPRPIPSWFGRATFWPLLIPRKHAIACLPW